MNKIIITGRLTKDIELKKLPNNDKSVASFTLAVNRDFKNSEGNYDADFINCTCFGTTADYIAKYLAKGKRACVSGRLQIRQYKAQDGSNRYATEVVADNVEVIDYNNSNSVGTPASLQGFTEVQTDEEVPF